MLSRAQRRLIIVIETVSLIALAAWLLSRMGSLFDAVALAVAGAIIVAGDLATVVLMQRFAPTRVLFEPAEKEPAPARVLEDFDGNGAGTVVLRGERWRARDEQGAALAAGEAVRVVARTGLELIVRRTDAVPRG